jgi:protein disulfide-isomerase A6
LQAGRIAEFDKLVDKFFTSSDKSKVVAQAKKLASKKEYKSDKYAMFYSKVLERLAKDPQFADKESTRLAKIVEAGEMNPAKLDDFATRQDILESMKGRSGGKAEDEKEEL